MPNWEEEVFGAALTEIWCNKCCNAIEALKNF